MLLYLPETRCPFESGTQGRVGVSLSNGYCFWLRNAKTWIFDRLCYLHACMVILFHLFLLYTALFILYAQAQLPRPANTSDRMKCTVTSTVYLVWGNSTENIEFLCEFTDVYLASLENKSWLQKQVLIGLVFTKCCLHALVTHTIINGFLRRFLFCSKCIIYKVFVYLLQTSFLSRCSSLSNDNFWWSIICTSPLLVAMIDIHYLSKLAADVSSVECGSFEVQCASPFS